MDLRSLSHMSSREKERIRKEVEEVKLKKMLMRKGAFWSKIGGENFSIFQCSSGCTLNKTGKPSQLRQFDSDTPKSSIKGRKECRSIGKVDIAKLVVYHVSLKQLLGR